MFAYIYSWLYPAPISPKIRYPEFSINRTLISENDLLNVHLKPFNVIPAPARNMPNMDKFTLLVLSKAQLNDILAVKLKKTNINPKEIHYEPRHPVLKELLMKIPKM